MQLCNSFVLTQLFPILNTLHIMPFLQVFVFTKNDNTVSGLTRSISQLHVTHISLFTYAYLEFKDGISPIFIVYKAAKLNLCDVYLNQYVIRYANRKLKLLLQGVTEQLILCTCTCKMKIKPNAKHLRVVKRHHHQSKNQNQFRHENPPYSLEM